MCSAALGGRSPAADARPLHYYLDCCWWAAATGACWCLHAARGSFHSWMLPFAAEKGQPTPSSPAGARNRRLSPSPSLSDRLTWNADLDLGSSHRYILWAAQVCCSRDAAHPPSPLPLLSNIATPSPESAFLHEASSSSSSSSASSRGQYAQFVHALSARASGHLPEVALPALYRANVPCPLRASE